MQNNNVVQKKHFGRKYEIHKVILTVADPGFSKWGALFCRKWGGAHPVFR